MNTAEEWAKEAIAYTFAHERESGRDAEHVGTLVVKAVALMFKEYARDQRHLIAERLSGWDALPLTTDDAHAVAMNARAPGESDA